MKLSKKILYPVLFAVVFIACCVGYYFYSESTNYFSTDNARVTAKMYSIFPSSNGKLLEWNIEKGDLVSKDENLGRQEVLPAMASPIDGTVVKCDVVAGQTVSPQSAIAVIADTDNMYIGVNIEETDIIKVAVGQTVEVSIDAYPNKKFQGKITEIDSATQTYFSSGLTSFTTSGTYTKVTQLVPVKVIIDNPEKLPMVFGMNCTVKIHVKS